ncbi:unnamed protein product [Thelazia callipaeda]|uniref:Integrase catalytic domain-containing protein n=1 Tax=Thelazia callipaeda TaxID=103827 RepID=A0A0N5D8J8_THECL|nr:unnamed protein product [Thelazia callipaeda]
MSLLDPASISLGEEEDEEENVERGQELLDSGCEPNVGVGVILDDDRANESAVVADQQISEQSCSATSDKGNGVNYPNDSRSFSFSGSHCVYQIIQKPKTTSDVRDPMLRVNLMKACDHKHLQLDQITDSIYADFIVLMTGGEVFPPTDDYRQILNAMVQGDDYTVACDVNDEFLGHIDYAIIHLPTMKLLLNSEQREQVIEFSVARFKNHQHPIGACLQMLQKNYIGLPSIINLRNTLLDSLNRLIRSGEDNTDYGGDLDDVDVHEFAVDNSSGDLDLVGKKGFYQNFFTTAIPDNEYDILAQILSKKLRVDDVEDVVLREAVKMRLKGSLLVGEYWSEPHEFLPPGWRIRIRESGRIVPRISEVDEIWRRCYERMPDCTQKEMLDYLEERYVGISFKTKQRAAAKGIILRAPRVQFPNKPRCIGSKPMQYVQIDMVEMECSEYGDRCYTMALIVTDLYSHFVFGRALAEAPDTSLLVRHLMDIFGAFAPPEAYRSFTNNEVIKHVMADIEKLFKIEIKNIGIGVMNHISLCSNMYKRAAEELGGRERWVEALPFAVIDYNQTPVKSFGDLRISPFEIMFGRRPWRNHTIPPWICSNARHTRKIDSAVHRQGNRAENINSAGTGASEVCMIRSMPLPRRPEVEERLATVYLSEMSNNRAKISCILGRYPAKFNDEGQVIDPGTGYLYDVGDCVYLRSLDHQEISIRSKKRINDMRYYRATIIEIDYQRPDFMYKVCYWDDIIDVDHLPPDQWPDEGSPCAWVSPYDIAPSTLDLAKQRNVVRRRELEFQCKCGYDFCELIYNRCCPYKLSNSCCKRLKMNCPYHSQARMRTRKLPAPSSSRLKASLTVGDSVLKLAAGGERRLLTVSRRGKSEVDHSNSRWVFYGDRYIELFPSSSTPVSVGPEDQHNNVHFDYDIGVHQPKRSRSQVFRSCYISDLLISNSQDDLEGMDVDDECIDVTSSDHNSTVDTTEGKVLPVRNTKRVSAPPQRLSPT